MFRVCNACGAFDIDEYHGCAGKPAAPSSLVECPRCGVSHPPGWTHEPCEPKPTSAPKGTGLVQYLWIGTLISGSGNKSAILDPLPDFEHKTLLVEKSAFDAVKEFAEATLDNVTQLREQVARLEAELEERRIATPTMNAVAILERELAEFKQRHQNVIANNEKLQAENAGLKDEIVNSGRFAQDYEDTIAELRADNLAEHKRCCDLSEQLTAARAEVERARFSQESVIADLTIERDKFRAALEWIAGKTDKPYCTYYERILPDGTEVPTYYDIAEKALAKEQP